MNLRFPTAVFLGAAILLAACGDGESDSGGSNETGADTTNTEQTTGATIAEPADGTTRLWVSAETVECEGVGPQTCLQVAESADGPTEYFYDSIEGFTHEAGTSYVIDVEITEVDDPPADGSSLAYRLVSIVESSP